MHLLIILLQQLLGLLQREQPVLQPEPVSRRAVDPRVADGRLGGEGYEADAFVLWNEPIGGEPLLTPTSSSIAKVGQRTHRKSTGAIPFFDNRVTARAALIVRDLGLLQRRVTGRVASFAERVSRWRRAPR